MKRSICSIIAPNESVCGLRGRDLNPRPLGYESEHRILHLVRFDAIYYYLLRAAASDLGN